MKKRKQGIGFWLSMAGAVLLFGLVQLLISAEIIDYYNHNIILNMGIFVILAVSLHLIIGITGQFSIGHVGFLAVGAYASAIITMKLELPFALSVLVGGIAAALAGLLIGIPTLRLKGDYLAIATLGFGEIVRIVFLNIDYVGGAAGMQVSHLTSWPWVFFCGLATIVVIRNFTNSTHGRACLSIREDETAADAMGINTTYYKVAAFVIGSFFAGVAGALWAHNYYIIAPSQFTFLRSFDILIFVVLGGLGSMSGAVIAAIFLTFVTAFLSDYTETRMIFYSAILIVMMIYRPQGLMGTKELTSLFSRKGNGKGAAKDGSQQTTA